MDSNQRDIPITEEDMGEGFMDPIDEEETFLERQIREQWKINERLKKAGAKKNLF